MSVSRYRLNAIGWVGAALFVLPTPLAVWEYSAALRRGDVGSGFAIYMTALATASLVGLVMLLIGREIVTTDR